MAGREGLWSLAAILAGAIALALAALFIFAANISSIADVVLSVSPVEDPVIVAVSLFSTIYERLILFALLFAVLLGLSFLRRFMPTTHELFVLAVACSLVLLAVFLVIPPLDVMSGFTAWGFSASAAPAMLLGFAFASLTWISGARFMIVPALVTASIAAIVPSGIRLFEAGSALFFRDDAVTTITPEPAFITDFKGNIRDFNGLAIDTVRRRLFADGHGVNNVYAYDLDAPTKPPLLSAEPTGGAESLSYNAADGEIYVFDYDDPKLLIIDATTLTLKSSVDNIEISPGDVLIAWDRHTRRLILASEADVPTPTSLIVLDRDNGKIVYYDDMAPGGIAIHPDKSWTYFSFYTNSEYVIVFDVASNEYVASGIADTKNLDGMAIDTEAKQVLVTAPLQSTIYRFDDTTMKLLGKIPAIFGVRSIAIDYTRDLLVCTSLVTGNIAVIDRKTHELLAQYRVAPWLRSVALDPQTGRAYVSSIYGLFVVDYLKRLPAEVAARNKAAVP